ncbi:MAG: non-heme iron oxygenase ferredoxin subunit [Anaerolineaceae bacterium]|nr:non-heme iron oxygenase ferredoxin subunit [Anaerolineaceae bacterium]
MSKDITYYEIGPADELPVGERWFIDVAGIAIVVFNISGSYYAIEDVCTHDDSPLGEGELDGQQIVCPRHGARFDVTNGKSLTPPAVEDILHYPIRVKGGQLEIGLTDN